MNSPVRWMPLLMLLNTNLSSFPILVIVEPKEPESISSSKMPLSMLRPAAEDILCPCILLEEIDNLRVRLYGNILSAD
jgi:hypothetical protein